MKTRILLVTAVVLFLTLSSCGKNEAEPQPSGAILPSVITYTRSTSPMPGDMISVTVKYEYDIRDRISKVHSEIFDGGISRGFVTTLAFIYDGVNHIRTVLTRTDIPGEEVDHYDYYRLGSEIIFYNAKPIEIDGGSRALNYRSIDNKTDYEFTYDAEGNATSVKVLALQAQTSETYALTHGESNGVFRNVKTPAWYLTTQMGAGSIHSMAFDAGELAYQQLAKNCIRSAVVGGKTVYEYNYTLNGDNYPTRIVRNPNFDGGPYVRYDIEYITAD